MFLKKIKNNNRGADMALIGTNYVLVLILVVCALIDLMVLEYGKMVVVSGLKECELYALAKNYNHELMFKEQNAEELNSVAENVRKTFNDAFYGSIAGSNGFMSNCRIIQNSEGVGGTGVFAGFGDKANNMFIRVPKVVFTPTKIIRNSPSFIPYVGKSLSVKTGTSVGETILGEQAIHRVSINGNDTITTGAATTITFIEQ